MEITIALALIELATKLVPVIEDKLKSGTLTPEDQQKTRDTYLAYRAAMDTAFSGPEWKLSTDSSPTVVVSITPPK